MKKLLSLFLAITVIAATLVCAMPITISAADAPIEATPLEVVLDSNNQAHRGWQNVGTVTTTAPLGFTVAEGLVAQQNANYAHQYAHESADDAVATGSRYVSINFAETKLFGASTGVIIYVKTDAANQIAPYIQLADGKILTAKVGTDYQYAPLGDTEWSTAQFGAGLGESKYFGKVSFDAAFEGYVKIPYTAIGYDNNAAFVFNPECDAVNKIAFYFKGLGTNGLSTSESTTVYGNAVVGPVFVVTKDTASTKISVPAEWQTAPIEATPIVNWTHSGAVTRSEVKPLGTVDASGLLLSVATPYDKGDGLASSGSHAIMDFTNNPYSLADTDGFLMYVKTDSANQLAFSVTAAGFGYGAAYVVEGRNFYTLSKGSDIWETKTITAGSTNKFVAALKFDEAFEGYVKIPYASLGSDHSATYHVFNNTYTATQFCFRFRALGGDFGTAIVGPVSLVTKDSPSAKITYPDEFIPTPIEATPIVNWTHSGAVTRSEVMPLEAVKANGLVLSVATPYDKGDGLAGSGSHAIMDFTNNPYSLVDTDGFLMYVKTDSANQLAFSVTAAGFGYGAAYVVEGRSFYTLSKGADAWETKTITAGSTNKFVAALKFDEAFEGYVKIPYASLGSDHSATYHVFNNTYTATQFCFRFRALGGDFGTAIVGPVSLVTKDSVSAQITYPQEYTPQPLDIKSFDFREVRASGYNYSAEKIEGTNNYNLYIGETVLSDTPVKHASGVEKWSYVENEDGKVASGGSTPLLMTPTVKTYMKDAEGMVFYVKFTKANKFAPCLIFDETNIFMLKPNTNVYLLANGSDEWQEKAVDIGHGENTLIYGMVSFDTAFEGYIKVPFTSFNNDSNKKLNFTGDNMSALTSIALRFKGIGDDTMYGKEVVVGVSGYYTEDTSVAAIGNIATPEYKNGDVNYDWKVDSGDLISARKSAMGIAGNTGYEVNVIDIVRIKKILAAK